MSALSSSCMLRARVLRARVLRARARAGAPFLSPISSRRPPFFFPFHPRSTSWPGLCPASCTWAGRTRVARARRRPGRCVRAASRRRWGWRPRVSGGWRIACVWKKRGTAVAEGWGQHLFRGGVRIRAAYLLGRLHGGGPTPQMGRARGEGAQGSCVSAVHTKTRTRAQHKRAHKCLVSHTRPREFQPAAAARPRDEKPCLTLPRNLENDTVLLGCLASWRAATRMQVRRVSCALCVLRAFRFARHRRPTCVGLPWTPCFSSQTYAEAVCYL